ncbi:MAG TPA: hypothetical protein VGK73_02060, partial [Polyangiaceae bacterium]
MFLKSLSAHLAIGLIAGFGSIMTEGSPAFAQGSPKPVTTGAAPAPGAGAQPSAAPAKPADASAKPADTSAAAKPAPAAKPPTKKERDAARKSYGEGEKAFAAGNFAVAQSSFQKANEAIPSPHADYWIAKSIDAQNKTEEAIIAYQTFLDNPNAAKAGDAKVQEAKSRIEALKATLVAEVVIETTPSNASVSVDGAPQSGAAPATGTEPAAPGTAPAPATPAGPGGPESAPGAPVTLKLTPGKHRVTVSAPGYLPKDLDLDVKGGDKLKHTVALAKEPPPPPPPPPPP